MNNEMGRLGWGGEAGRQEQIGTAVERAPFREAVERAWRFSWISETPNCLTSTRSLHMPLASSSFFLFFFFQF